jgi:hypothetical protein
MKLLIIDSATDPIANLSIPDASICARICRKQNLANIPYRGINNNNQVLVYLAGFYVKNVGNPINSNSVFGLITSPISIGTSSFTLNVTVYGYPEFT